MDIAEIIFLIHNPKKLQENNDTPADFT
jgi:hypothetical protein